CAVQEAVPPEDRGCTTTLARRVPHRVEGYPAPNRSRPSYRTLSRIHLTTEAPRCRSSCLRCLRRFLVAARTQHDRSFSCTACFSCYAIIQKYSAICCRFVIS